MAETNLDEDLSANDELQRRIARILYFGLAAAVIAIAAYVVNFWGRGLSDSTSNWGEFGDYAGGVLNPTFSFLSLIAILGTMIYQVRELNLTHRELKHSSDALKAQNETMRKQAFEATFFQMLRLLNEVVNAVDLRDKGGNVSLGRDCFRVFLDRLEKQLGIEGFYSGEPNLERFRRTYDKFYRDHDQEIGHYFRLLYNIIKFVKRSEGVDKKFYTNLVRAQLSSAEVRLLFYNCLSELGVQKFKPLIEEFGLLKMLPQYYYSESRSLWKEYERTAFGDSAPLPLTPFGTNPVDSLVGQPAAAN